MRHNLIALAGGHAIGQLLPRATRQSSGGSLFYPPEARGCHAVKLFCYDRHEDLCKVPAIQDYPIPIAIIVASFWIIQQIIAGNAKQIAALIDAFDARYAVLIKNYETLVQAAFEDRQEARQRWIERDRLMYERIERNTAEFVQSKSEIHQLRNTMQAQKTTIELIAREVIPERGSRSGDGDD